MQAFSVLLRYELEQLTRSWVIRAWVLLLVVPAVVLVGVAANGTEVQRASEALALYEYAVFAPLSWLAVSIFAASSVSGEAGVMADAILSKSVNRSEYLWAKIASRLGTTVIVYLLVTVPLAYLLTRYAVPDTTGGGLLSGVMMVGVLVAFLAALGILVSTVFRNVQLAILMVMMAVLFSGAILQFLGLHWMSTTSILNSLPSTFRGETSLGTTLRVLVMFGALTTGAITASLWLFRNKDL